MENLCPLDLIYSREIAALLKNPSPQEVQKYFDEIVKTRECGLRIKQDGKHGKGVYAEKEFGEGDLVLKDQMLVGAQDSSNKVDCLVCSYCFHFIGSVELQIGRKLYLKNLGLTASGECGPSHSHTLNGYDSEDSSGKEDDFHMPDTNNLGSCSFSNPSKSNSLPGEFIQSLMNGDIALPYSNEFLLPSAIPCPSGCGEAYYCSKTCAEADWEFFHSLLCTGKNSSRRDALLKFIEHANDTNGIFILAAKAIANTILRYKKLKVAYLEDQERHSGKNANKCSEFSLLLEAWKPISMGYKKRWWDCVAFPADIESVYEASFRMDLQELAFKSLELLKEAIFEQECAPLFSLEIYAHIIGMFELNNLDLVVASPVEDYFLNIDELPPGEREKAEKITQPILDALGEEYSDCCGGTAFFPLQSCMNHSCCPNAKAFKRDEDKDGQATIIALRPISKDEEITISYIDEDLPFQERQAKLADYGFRCRCPKCLAEGS